MRTLDEFVGVITAQSGDFALDHEAGARAVFTVLAGKVSPGEIEDVKRNLPQALRELWPR